MDYVGGCMFVVWFGVILFYIDMCFLVVIIEKGINFNKMG